MKYAIRTVLAVSAITIAACSFSGDFSSEKIAMDFVELCKGQEDFIRPVYIAILKPRVDKYGNEKLDKKTGKPLMRYCKHRELPK